jgi:hypothetical protein
MKSLTLVVALFSLFVFAASAADVTGHWKGSYTSPDGQTRESTFDLKAEGSTLTGKVIGARGEVPIQEGKVSGDEISFVVVRNFGGNEVKILYKGKVSGNEIKFNVSMGPDRTFDMTAKKVS